MRQFRYLFLTLCFLTLPSYVFANEIIKLPNYSFKYAATTTASKETIWKIWSDVENWKDFDERIQYSYLVGENKFIEGAIGYFKGKNAPKTKFELIEVNPYVSFIQCLKIPLYQTIELQRYFEESEEGSTTFVHEVNFTGPLRAVTYGLLRGPFKKDLKLVIESIKKRAEAKDTQN